MKKYIPYIIIIALGVALLFAVQRCSSIQKTANANAYVQPGGASYYKNKLGTVTATNNTLQYDKKQLQDLLLKKDAQLAALAKEFAQVNSVVKFNTTTEVDSIPAVVFHDTIPCVFDRAGSIKEQWYGFGYRVNQRGLQIDSLTLPNTVTVITGTKRNWFLGKETLTTDVTNSNPYVKVTGITAAQLTVPVPWYKKWYVWAAVGGVGGFLLSK